MTADLPDLNVTSLARLVCDAWDEWTNLIADGLEDPDVAHKATPAQRRFIHLMEAWTTLAGLPATSEGRAQGLALARWAAGITPPITAALPPF